MSSLGLLLYAAVAFSTAGAAYSFEGHRGGGRLSRLVKGVWLGIHWPVALPFVAFIALEKAEIIAARTRYSQGEE